MIALSTLTRAALTARLVTSEGVNDVNYVNGAADDDDDEYEGSRRHEHDKDDESTVDANSGFKRCRWRKTPVDEGVNSTALQLQSIHYSI